MPMFFNGIGTAVPSRRYTQAECWHAVQSSKPFTGLASRSQALLRKVLLGRSGIETRGLCLESLDDAFDLTPDRLHERFATHAPSLATQAGAEALARSGVLPEAVDGLIVSTCTGYLCPGLTSYVSERLGLRANALLLDLVGQGCGAAIPNLRTAEALLQSAGCEHVLSICVEICSAAFYLDDDPGVLISACLFGDAAGAALVSSAPTGERRTIEWQGASTILRASERGLLRFEQQGGMLRNILTPQVPQIAAREASDLCHRFLKSRAVAPEDISAWIWHAGGREVLSAAQKELALAPGDLDWSAAVLRDLGNVSSACVYHVLDRALEGAAPGGYWWMSTFGAGFSCHGALLRVG